MPPVKTMGPSVQGWVLPHLIACVEGQGANASALRQIPGFSNLDDPDVRVPEAAVETAWRSAAALTRDEALGVHVAESLPRGALDLVEYAFRSSASLAAGVERLARYGRVLTDRVAARTEAANSGLLLLVGDIGRTPLHPGRAEFALGVALKLARDATGVDLAPLQVSFAHPAPDDVSEHRRFFRAPVRFAAGSTSMILGATDGLRPLLGADAALCAIVRRRLEKALLDRDIPVSGSLSARVRRMLVEDLGQARLQPASVAKELAVSRRTLSRRLAAENTSFRRLLDEVRAEFALALLQDRRLSVGDIAFFLQYSEPAAFHRSFRRWTGRTPRDYRTDTADGTDALSV
jgi:AraC-like DNA-binding protein